MPTVDTHQMISRRKFMVLSIGLAAKAGAQAPGLNETKVKHLEDAMRSHLDGLAIPGGQLAVGNQDGILFSRGFGMADRDKGLAVTTETLFRIASISKPFTAVGIVTLIEQEKLSLQDRVMEILQPDIFQPDASHKPDPRLQEITIQHLLQHTAGWDRDASGDAMFQSRRISERLSIPSPPSTEDVIREVLSRPLDFAPGSRYAYSNFGYCLLGRVIEKKSGQPYEQYVQQSVLKPAGALRTRLGKTLIQVENESRYYMSPNSKEGTEGRAVFPNLPEKVPWPYGGWSLEMMDSHGGWISTADDLVRFGSALQDWGKRSPFRQKSSATLLVEAPPGKPGEDDKGKKKTSYYGCGFSVRSEPRGKTLSHSGSLSGTSSVLFIRPDGLTWAALFNQREDMGPKDAAITKAINAILDEK